MFEPKWELRISNDQYDIWDSHVAGQTISVTHLKAKQKTNGHEHPNYELYIPLSGKAELLTGASSWRLSPSQGIHAVYCITPDTFHQVVNGTENPADFLCLFEERKCSQ